EPYPVQIKSYEARFQIEGQRLHVYGGLRIRIGEWEWGDPLDYEPEYVYVGSEKLPVVPLRLKTELYIGLGWRDRVKKLDAAKVTKDAVDIVNELGVQYPAIKTLVEAAKIHREDAGDGVSTLVILLSSLLTEADRLIEVGVHPVAILEGYKDAAKKCLAIIDQVAEDPARDIDV